MSKIIKIEDELLACKGLLLRIEQIDKRIEAQNERLDIIILRLSKFLENRDGIMQYPKFLS